MVIVFDGITILWDKFVFQFEILLTRKIMLCIIEYYILVALDTIIYHVFNMFNEIHYLGVMFNYVAKD